MSMLNSRTYIPGVGPKDATVVIVGEAPGAEEVRQGQPFVGPSGTILTKLLYSVNLGRQDCYITNVIKERPANNDPSSFIEFKRGGVYTTPAFDKYVQELKAELEKTSANVIIALGNIPLYALTGRQGITKLRGSIMESTLLPGRKVIPTIHPAAALRQYIYQHFIQFDLRRVVSEAAYPEIRTPVRCYHLEPSFLDACAFLDNIKQTKRRTGCDIEVVNEEVSCISFTHGPYEAISIPFVNQRNNYFRLDQEAVIWWKIASILEDPDIVKVFQNGNFDITFLFTKYGILTRNIEDTMIAQAVMYPDLPKGLDFITSIYTKEPYYKDEGKKWFRFGGTIRDFWLYNAKDAAVCDEAIDPLMVNLERFDNMSTYRTQVDLIEPLVYMQCRGIKVDIEGREKASAEDLIEIERLDDLLKTSVGFNLNYASPKQLVEYFYGKLKLKPYLNRKTGKPTTDDMALKRLARKGIEAAQIIRDIRSLAKRRSTYLEMPLDKDGRIRCSFNPVGTNSLRLSSSKTIFDTGGNMQNLPNDVREYLIADDDCIPYQADLGQAENRCVAYIAPEPAMIFAFESGIDIHKQTAALIFGIPIEEVSDEDGSSEIGGGVYSQRFWGKKANHGLNYDLGYKSFALLYEIPEADAKFIIDRYHTAYPGVRQMHTWVRNQLAKDRTLTNCFGWKRLFLERWGDDLFKEAYSFIPQSSIARQLNEHGVIRGYYEVKGAIEILNQVHDSIWFQIPKRAGWLEHARILLELKGKMETPMNWRGRSFVVPADFEMGLRNWGKRTDKPDGRVMNPGGLSKLKYTTKTPVHELAAMLEAKYNQLRA